MTFEEFMLNYPDSLVTATSPDAEVLREKIRAATEADERFLTNAINERIKGTLRPVFGPRYWKGSWC